MSATNVIKANVAIAHLREGDLIVGGTPLAPPGRVASVAMRRNERFLQDNDFEASSSHLFTIHFTDGRQAPPLNGSRRVVVERAA